MSLARSVLTGTAWSVAMRWSTRLLGLVSISILARLLSPDDYGVAAMAAAVTGLTVALFQFGVDFAVIRERHITPQFLDCAWTLKALQGLTSGLIVALIAPFANQYFNDPRVEAVLYVSAITLVVSGFHNIGLAILRRDMRFAADFRFNVLTRLGGTTITIALAFWLRSYWALVWGVLATNVLLLWASFVWLPERPRIRFQGVGRIWSFSKWMILTALLDYFRRSGDRLIFGSLAVARDLGLYSMSREIAALPTEEVVLPVNRVVTPALAKLLDEPARLAAATIRTLGVLAGLAAPLSLGLAAVSDEAVAIVLGDQWREAGQFIAIFCITGVALPLFSTFGNLLVVTGFERLLTGLSAAWTAITMSGLLIGYMHGGLAHAAAGFTCGHLMAAVLFTKVTLRVTEIPIAPFIVAYIRPVAAAIFMWAVLAHGGIPWNDGTALRAAQMVATGACIYSTTALISWLAMGRPNSLEKLVLETVARHPKCPRFLVRMLGDH